MSPTSVAAVICQEVSPGFSQLGASSGMDLLVRWGRTQWTTRTSHRSRGGGRTAPFYRRQCRHRFVLLPWPSVQKAMGPSGHWDKRSPQAATIRGGADVRRPSAPPRARSGDRLRGGGAGGVRELGGRSRSLLAAADRGGALRGQAQARRISGVVGVVVGRLGGT